MAQANTNPELEKVQEVLAPKLAAHRDAIYLNEKLFRRVAAVYEARASLKLSPEGLRLVEVRYRDFVHAGANLSDADKDKLKKLNEEESTLSNGFRSKVLAGTKDAAYATKDKAALAGLTGAALGGGGGGGEGAEEGWVCASAAEHDAAARSFFVECEGYAAGDI